MIQVDGKSLGQKQRLFTDFSIPVPPELGEEGGLTLRALIAKIVAAQVWQFKERQDQRRFLRVLTEKQIAEAVEQGKIESGESDVGKQKVDVDEAIGVAYEAFEDGLYFVVIDDDQIEKLDQQVYLTPDSRVTFIRLTPLAGG
jgi:hypothetical protein